MAQFGKAIFGAAVLTLMAGGASAATIYASSVTALKGTTPSTCTVAERTADRSNICNALGAPDGDADTGGGIGFVSSGLYDSLTFGFDKNFTAPVTVFEITGNRDRSYVEKLDLTFSVVSGGQTYVGTIINTSGMPGADDDQWAISVMFDAKGPFSSITVSDNSSTPDGFDIDAIAVSAIPVPAAGFMLLAGLGGLAAARRRKA